MRKLLKFILNPKVKSTIILFFLLCCYIFICAFNYVQAVSSDISSSMFRLHVLANSDSTSDQQLKIKVRNGVIDSLTDSLKEIGRAHV